jgi:formate hydrogenlyase transcriptional activator
MDQLSRTTVRYQTLLEVNRAALTHSTPHHVFTDMCSALGRVVPYDRAGLMMYEPEEDALKVVGLSGSLPGSFFRIGAKIAREQTPHGLALENQKVVIRRDIEAEAQFAIEELSLSEGLHSYCAVPLVVRGNSVGVVTMLSYRQKQYSQRHAEFLQETSNQIVLAVLSLMQVCATHPRSKLICPRCIGSSGGQRTTEKYKDQLSGWGKKGGRGRKIKQAPENRD